jgi:hypothetical protein
MRRGSNLLPSHEDKTPHPGDPVPEATRSHRSASFREFPRWLSPSEPKIMETPAHSTGPESGGTRNRATLIHHLRSQYGLGGGDPGHRAAPRGRGVRRRLTAPLNGAWGCVSSATIRYRRCEFPDVPRLPPEPRVPSTRRPSGAGHCLSTRDIKEGQGHEPQGRSPEAGRLRVPVVDLGTEERERARPILDDLAPRRLQPEFRRLALYLLWNRCCDADRSRRWTSG